MKKAITKILVSIILGVLIGFLLNYFVISEIIYMYFNFSETSYVVISIIAFVVQIIFCAALVYIIINKKLNQIMYKIIVITYCSIMIVLLFGRPYLSRELNLDLFSTIVHITSEDVLLMGLNFIAFVPVGYLLRKQKTTNAFFYSALLSFCIEGLQYITCRGVADIVDIVIYLLAINLSYNVVKKLKIDLVAKKEE